MNNVISLPIKKFNIQETEDFLFLSANIIKEGKNLNRTIFTLDGMDRNKDSFKEKPILCSIYQGKSIMSNGKIRLGDGHNNDGVRYDKETEEYYESFISDKAEKPVGFTPSDSTIYISNIDGENWICVDKIIIWKKYNYELCKMLKNKRTLSKKVNISVEIDVLLSEEADGWETIHDWRGLGITILALDDSVSPAITGASIMAYCLTPEYNKFKTALAFAYKGDNSIILKKDKECFSENDFDFEEVRIKVLMSSNSENIINDVFLYVKDDWKENKDSLKYLVMEIDSENQAVYNKKALENAVEFAKKNNESGILFKLKTIYKSLGLKWEADSKPTLTIKPKKEGTVKMKKFSNVPENYTYIGSNEKIALFSSENTIYSCIVLSDGEQENFNLEALTPMSVFCKIEDNEIDMANVMCDFVAKQSYEVSEKAKTLSEKETEIETYKLNFEKLEEEKKMADEKMQTLEAEKTMAEEKLAQAETEKKMAEEKLEENKKAMEAEKMEKLSAEVACLMEAESCKMSDEFKKEITEKCAENKYSTIEDAKKDIAYAIYTFELEKNKARDIKYSLKNDKSAKVEDIFSAAKNAVKKL